MCIIITHVSQWKQFSLILCNRIEPEVTLRTGLGFESVDCNSTSRDRRFQVSAGLRLLWLSKVALGVRAQVDRIWVLSDESDDPALMKQPRTAHVDELPL